jgi:peptide/nickel transport system permease protein
MPTARTNSAGGAPGAEADIAAHAFLGKVVHRFVRQKAALGASGILIILIFSAVAAPLLTPQDPLRGVISQRLQPVGTPGHLLGTDEQGRDVFTRILYGGRISLATGIIPVCIATVVGTVIGATAGFLGGWVAALLMRTMDMFYAFPALLLAIAISSSLGPGITNAIIALSIVFIAPISRVALVATQQEVVKEYVEAARLSGASTPQLIMQQVLMNIFSTVFVYAAGLIGVSILAAAGLSFLGLGAKPPAPEWGYMLNSLRGSLYVQPWVVAVPGLFIFAAAMAFNLLSDAINEALDIKSA